MKRWLRVVAALALVPLVGACQGAWSLGENLLPVPPVVTAPQLDPPAAIVDAEGQRVKPDLPAGFPWITRRGEERIGPYIGMSKAAWEEILLGYEALRRAYCEGRATVEIANGGAPEDIPLCHPSP